MTNRADLVRRLRELAAEGMMIHVCDARDICRALTEAADALDPPPLVRPC